MGHDAATTPALLAGAGTASADTHRDDQPMLTVSSPECETLRLDYGDRGPPISVDVSGPDAFTTALDRGEQVDREVAPGSYEVTARPAESDVDRVITVEGSPIEVEPCGIIARLDCSRENSLIFENPLDHTVWIRYRRKYVHDGWWISGWLELPAGGTVNQSGDAST